MPGEETVTGRVAYGYVLHFNDGGKPEEQVLGVGSPEEAERMRTLLPAVAYSGDRPISHAEWATVPVEGGDGDA